LPPIYLMFFFGMTFLTIFLAAGHKWEQPWIFKNFAYVMLLHGSVMLLMAGTVILYLIYIFKSNMDQQIKMLWAIVIFVGGPIAMVAFWFMNIWREPEEKVPR